MKKLLLKRFYLQNKNVVKTLLLYTLVITISMCFSTILLVIYDNKVTQYYQSSYDYMLRYFDDNIIELLEENEHIKDTYKVGIYNYEMKHRNKSESVEVFYVPYWDEEGLTYLSDKRKVKGSISNDENSIMIDALLAHELNVDIGDIVYVKNNGKDIPFKINVIIEPFGSRVKGRAIFICNEYVKENMGVSNDNLLCSELFVKTDGSKEIEEYFFYELMPPEHENLTKEEIYQINISSIDKKEWEIEDAEEELEHTPPVTICISLLALVIIFIFVLREATSQKINSDKDIAILESLGMKRKEIMPVTMIGQEIIIIPAIGVSSVLVKIIYDNLIANYYLSYRIIFMEAIVLLIVSLVTCFLVSLIVVIKNKKKSISELLNVE